MASVPLPQTTCSMRPLRFNLLTESLCKLCTSFSLMRRMTCILVACWMWHHQHSAMLQSASLQNRPFKVGESALTPDLDALVVWNGCNYALQERGKDTVHQGHVLAQEERTPIAIQLSIHLIHCIYEGFHAHLVTPTCTSASGKLVYAEYLSTNRLL